MRQRDRGTAYDAADADQHDRDLHESFFGGYDDGDDGDDAGSAPATGASGSRPDAPAATTRRAERAKARASSSHSRFVVLSILVLVAMLGVTAWWIGPRVYGFYRDFHPSNYTGAGAGSVVVTVDPNDDASKIGQTLHQRGVVASVRAFTDAATSNSRSQSIQPGSYRLHRHMAASKALTLLLDPAARIRSDVLVPEGATTLDVAARLRASPCNASAPAAQICGPGLSPAGVTAALRDVSALGLPIDYTVSGRAPSSAEGFLFPATYVVSGKSGAGDALKQMIANFTDEVRTLNFTGSARALHITPYQELVVASIAQAEAKFPADYAKVARVLLNRLAAQMPLQVDATSAYAAKLKRLDPAKVIYAQIDSPYNTYQHAGLPPTPIDNPGVAALKGAAAPAGGNWLYYVNADAAGHLFFTSSAADFTKAAATCRAHHWGCG